MPASSPFSLVGQTALITGASSGLGAHFAKVLADAGAKVVLAARRVDRLEALAAEIKAAGGTAYPVAMDVTDGPSIVAAFDAAEKALGPVSVLINNAGVPSHSPFLKVGMEEWRATMAVNLDGVFAVGREAADRVAKRGATGKGGGSIINIASILGLTNAKWLSPYCTSKAAVVSLTKNMALELARYQIRVNAIAPGYFSTEINAGFLETEAGKAMLTRIPFRRFGQLSDLDGPLLLLASDAGRFMTGSVVTVDGGHLVGGV
jgi:NAD(P)-dependent dehydrogenase (short-subunit alcohol dehydrogenase family)